VCPHDTLEVALPDMELSASNEIAAWSGTTAPGRKIKREIRQNRDFHNARYDRASEFIISG